MQNLNYSKLKHQTGVTNLKICKYQDKLGSHYYQMQIQYYIETKSSYFQFLHCCCLNNNTAQYNIIQYIPQKIFSCLKNKNRGKHFICAGVCLLLVYLQDMMSLNHSSVSPTAMCNQCLFYATLTISISICIITFSSCSVLSLFIY